MLGCENAVKFCCTSAVEYLLGGSILIQALLNSYLLALADVRAAVEELPEALMVRQFPGVPNHPAWTIGHLVYSAQAIGGEIGIAPWLPSSWVALFRTGSTPLPEAAAYPSRSELLGALSDAQARITLCLNSLSPKALAAPLPDVRFRLLFPSVGHAAVHVLSGHTSFHLGQLSVWRRAAGLPSREPA
jgi:hypothetical protein